VLSILSIASGARQCVACWWGPPESTGLEEERSSRALRSEMERTIFNSEKYKAKRRKRRLPNQVLHGP
jgi:hypothetical protein